MTPPGLLAIAGRVAIVYVLMLAMIRLLGKRTIGNLTAFDMIIALIMGDLAGTAIYGEVPIMSAVVAVATLSVIHYANSWLVLDRPKVAQLLEGEATVIVEHGRLVRRGLKREHMSEEEAVAELRLEGIDDLSQVKLARVERDGRVSVVREEWAEPARRGDVGLAD